MKGDKFREMAARCGDLPDSVMALPPDDDWSGDKIPRVAGATFYCERCGPNVFRSRMNDSTRYKCNGCGAMYRGE